LSRSMIRVPYDPKGFNQDELLDSFQKQSKNFNFNWKSNKKFREQFSVMETGTSGRKQLSIIRGEDIIIEHRSEGNRSFGTHMPHQDESLGKIAQKAAEEKLPEFGFGASSIRKSSRIPGPSQSRNKPRIRQTMGSSVDLQVRAREGDEDDIEDNEEVIMGEIKESQNEHLPTENHKSTGRLVETLSQGVEQRFHDFRNFFTPLHEKAMELKKKVSGLPPLQTPKGIKKLQLNSPKKNEQNSSK